jgi:hypothetical protein
MELIPIPGAEIYYEPRFLQPDEATALFNTLLSTCAWERRKGQFGHPVPRSEAYFGDPGTPVPSPRMDVGIAVVESAC